MSLAREAGYSNAGTVEFLVDDATQFLFSGSEHALAGGTSGDGVVTGLDLVKLQIHVAAGEPLPFHWQEIHPRGHAIECRIYAEDPDNNFFPSPGKITSRRAPSGPGVRLDEGVYEGWVVPNGLRSAAWEIDRVGGEPRRCDFADASRAWRILRGWN